VTVPIACSTHHKLLGTRLQTLDIVACSFA